ncbi:MAG: polysaccharide deacetylase family protein [Proteobacteria bacterium]|nr:polysaccharide deacetylase family protein [Pseudomonadota bacterium]
MLRLGPILITCTLSALVAASASSVGWIRSEAAVGVCIAAVLVMLVAVIAGSANPALQLFGPAVLRGPSGRGVALTFDDGPDKASTMPLLEALDAAGARATFFVLVEQVEAHPELAKALAKTQEIGLHGLSHHPWLTVYDPERGAAELRDAMARLEAVTGIRPRWYRPPFGAVSPRLCQAVERAGLTMVWCSVRTGDGGRMNAATLRERCAKAKDGDIVLMHDGERAAKTALPDILADLRARALAPVSVGELLA